MMVSAAFAVAFATAAHSSLLDEVRDADVAADAALTSIRTCEQLAALKSAWRTWWLDALGGMPERTPLNARVTGTVECDGFANPYWLFSCDGPHGLPPSTRAAQVDWMRHCILGADAPRPLDAYRALDSAGTDNNDPAGRAPLPFSVEALFCTPTRQVRDLPRFRSVYSVIADEAVRLEKLRKPKTREKLREIVRRRANIRSLAELGETDKTNFDHRFKWWYLEGREGKLAENHAAILAMMGRSRVGVKAEAILRDAARRVAANGGKPVVLEAKGADCIAAAHAYAAEPQLFSSVRFIGAPPSWTEMATNLNPRLDSFAVAVWGALKEYDWTELTRGVEQ